MSVCYLFRLIQWRHACALNGKASIVFDQDLAAAYRGAKRIVRVECCFIYTNSNHFIPQMEFLESSVFSPNGGYCPPEPEWKSRDHARDVLFSIEKLKA
jgi:hypothetical protein